MKLCILALLANLLLLPAITFAQTQTDSTLTRKWYAPDGVTLQFAGNIGMVAAGVNYSFLKDKVNAELLYGFVPAFDSDEALHLLTLKGIYKPFNKVKLSDTYTLTPLRTNLAVSYYLNDEFPVSWDDSYPEGYYWWRPALRFTGGFGTEVSRKLPQNNLFRKITLYAEAGTYDLIVTSAFKDKALSAWDILSFSVGLKAGF